MGSGPGHVDLVCDGTTKALPARVLGRRTRTCNGRRSFAAPWPRLIDQWLDVAVGLTAMTSIWRAPWLASCFGPSTGLAKEAAESPYRTSRGGLLPPLSRYHPLRRWLG